MQKMKIDEIQNQIIDEMFRFEDWMDKYEHLIEQGKGLDQPGEQIRTEENSIPGCQSRVWISAKLKNGIIRLTADSDALITRGILALLLKALDNQSPEDIAQADLYFIREIGLSTNLSPSRANGLATIIKQIKSYAAGFSSK